MYTLYGIKNCDTVKKALNYLKEQGLSFQFVDFKQAPPRLKDLKRWKTGFGEWPINRQSPTFRQIREAFEQASGEEQAALLIAHPSALKRPILEGEGLLLKGFDPQQWPQAQA